MTDAKPTSNVISLADERRKREHGIPAAKPDGARAIDPDRAARIKEELLAGQWPPETDTLRSGV